MKVGGDLTHRWLWIRIAQRNQVVLQAQLGAGNAARAEGVNAGNGKHVLACFADLLRGPATQDRVCLPLGRSGGADRDLRRPFHQRGLDRAGRALEDLVVQAPGRTDESGELWEPLSNLLLSGPGPRSEAGRDNASAFNKIQRAFTKSRRAAWSGFDPEQIPVVEVIAHDIAFPVELLPVFLPTSPLSAIRNDADLMRTAERFLGFTTVVRRVAPELAGACRTQRSHPTLAIQFMRYVEREPRGFLRKKSKLGRGFVAEQAFQRLLKPLSVDGPWPTKQLSTTEVVQRLVDVLFDPSQTLGADPPALGAAALAHFACHLETQDRSSEDFELTLSDEDGDPLDRPPQRHHERLCRTGRGHRRRGSGEGPRDHERVRLVVRRPMVGPLISEVVHQERSSRLPWDAGRHPG